MQACTRRKHVWLGRKSTDAGEYDQDKRILGQLALRFKKERTGHPEATKCRKQIGPWGHLHSQRQTRVDKLWLSGKRGQRGIPHRYKYHPYCVPRMEHAVWCMGARHRLLCGTACVWLFNPNGGYFKKETFKYLKKEISNYARTTNETC